MKQFSVAEEITRYDVSQIQPNGNLDRIGNLQFSHINTTNGFVSEVNKDISIPGSSVKESFQVNYDKKLNITGMCAKGISNGMEYEFNCICSKGKFHLKFIMSGQEKKHSEIIKKNYYENNTFPFLLIPLLGGENSINIEVFVPLTAAYVSTGIQLINSSELFLFNGNDVKCERFRISAEGDYQSAQYFLYSRDTGRMMKGIVANQVIEISEIIK